jgi:hypothetical protein
LSLCRLKIGLQVAWGLKKKRVFISLLEIAQLSFYVTDVGDGFEFVDDFGCNFFVDNVD